MAIDVQTFKNIMSHWATGISVITTFDGDEFLGFTANSFASVSVSPYLVSMSVAKTLYTGDVIQRNRVFTVNILNQYQEEWGKLFAGVYKDRLKRFEGIDVTIGENGCPILPDVMGYMECEIYQTVDVGASTLILGEVKNGAFYDGRDPLLYYHRQWGKFSPNN
jgi:flavin reductase (DIM6/NTAB) family NADH-FMN oxidoreductase RutF